eukprot:2145875-Rhodomonas_salina.1
MLVKDGKKKTFLLHPGNLKKLSPVDRLPSDSFMQSTPNDDDSAVDNFNGPYDILRSLLVQPAPITLSLKQLSYTVKVASKSPATRSAW